MRRIGLIIVFLALSSISAQAGGADPAGLCSPKETTFFACQTTKQRWISLCGNLPRMLQYRFGSTKRLELRYPGNVAGGVNKFMFAHYLRYQTDRIEIGFSNQGVDYAVFDYTEDRDRRAGARITTADGKENEFICSGPITSRLLELDKILPCDPDNALNGGSCPR
jgi:hypothetical protein